MYSELGTLRRRFAPLVVVVVNRDTDQYTGRQLCIRAERHRSPEIVMHTRSCDICRDMIHT